MLMTISFANRPFVRRSFLLTAALTLCLCQPALAAKTRSVGNWFTSSEDDHFGDGGNYSAFTSSGMYAFGVRCLTNSFSYAVLSDDIKGQRNTPYRFKFRVDKGDVYPGIGIAIDDKIVQIIANPAMTKDLMSGQELAIKQEFDGTTFVGVLNLRGATKALADVIKNCPLEKQETPKFDENGDLDTK